MKAIILAGGYGTRLQPLTLRTPKCVLPVGDTTTILRILDQLEDAGVEEVIISLNKNQEKVKRFLNSQNTNLNIEYIFEDTEKDDDKLGAIGALLYVIEEYGEDDYFVLGADNYTKGLDYKNMLEQHESKEADATIALFELRDVTKVCNFGIGVLDDDNRILKFQEKPPVEEALSRLASTFIYIISRDFFKNELKEYVKREKKKSRKPDDIGDLWEHYSTSKKIYGYKFKGYWGDVGKPLHYVEINHKALEGVERITPSSLEDEEGVKITGNVKIGEDCEVEPGVVIIGPCIIGDNCTINQGSLIGPYTTLLRNVTIGKDNIVNGSIIFEGVETEARVKVTRAIIDGNSRIHEGNKIEEKAMIGYNCTIEEGSQILYDTKLWPFLNIDENSIINGKVYYDLKNMIHESRIKESCYWK